MLYGSSATWPTKEEYVISLKGNNSRMITKMWNVRPGHRIFKERAHYCFFNAINFIIAFLSIID